MASAAQAQSVIRLPRVDRPSFVGYVRDEVVVVMEAGHRAALERVESSDPAELRVRDAVLQGVLDRFGVLGVRRQFPASAAQGSRLTQLSGHYKLRLPAGSDPAALIRALETAAGVDHVERIGIHSTYATPNDGYYQGSPNPSFDFDQWHYWDSNGIDADLAWDLTTGSPDVIVGILDSGVRYYHVDLGGNSPQWGPDAPFDQGNIWINSQEIAGNGVDDDGNGFTDDTIGWDFVSDASSPGVTCIDADCVDADNDPDDGDGHGSHVGGTVGAITNNGRLVAGVAGGFGDGTPGGPANGVKILPLRIGFHGRYQGITGGLIRMDWAAEAMVYLAGLIDAGENVTAINCSWGSSNSGGIDAAVDALLTRDVLIVHAAGNSNSTSGGYLGGKAGVMNVAATAPDGSGASFSNYGSWVDVAAPGVEILSTYANPDDPDLTNHYIAVLDGTSMSAPHVCGIAALLESCDPSLSGPDKFTLITGNTTSYTDPRDLGSGIANANLALLAAGCTLPCDLTAAFSAVPDSGLVPLLVDFSDQSTGAPLSWEWDFGDGFGSTSQNPSHLFVTPGEYPVSLIVQSACGTDSLLEGTIVSVADTTNATAAPQAGASLLRAKTYPNPFNPQAVFEFEMPRKGHARIELFDVAGRRMRLLFDGELAAGVHSRRFDGRDDRGRELAAGTYFYRISTGANRVSGKFALVK